MGDSSTSMLYVVLILGGAYVVGMSIYSLFKFIQKKISEHKDQKYK